MGRHRARGGRDPLHPRLRCRTLRLRAPRGQRAGDRGLRLRGGQPRHRRGAVGRLARRRDLQLRVPARREDSDIAAGRVRFIVAGAGRRRRDGRARAWWWPPMARTRRCAPRRASPRTSRTTNRWRWWRTWPTDRPHDGMRLRALHPDGPARRAAAARRQLRGDLGLRRRHAPRSCSRSMTPPFWRELQQRVRLARRALHARRRAAAPIRCS